MYIYINKISILAKTIHIVRIV